MANFSYDALDNSGESESGYLIADSVEEAKNELKNRKLIPLKAVSYTHLRAHET